jgi:hypothetical protein
MRLKKRNPTAKRNAWFESVRRLMLKIYAVDRKLRGAKEKKKEGAHKRERPRMIQIYARQKKKKSQR